MIGHGGDFDDVRVHGGQPCMDRRQIGGRLVKIVMADDPLGAAVARDAGGDVVLEIDIVGRPLRSRFAAQAGGLPPIDSTVRRPRAAAGRNDGTVTFSQQTRHLHRTLDVVEPKFHQADAVLGQILVFGDDVPVPAPSDADADHGDFRKMLAYVRRNCLSRS